MNAGPRRERRLLFVVAAFASFTAVPAIMLAAGVKNAWILSGASAGAAILAATAGVWQDRLRRSTQRRDDLQYGVIDGCLVLRGRLPKVHAVDNPTWLGIHPSAAVAEPAAPGTVGGWTTVDSVPAYVPRDIDGELRRCLAGNAFVVIVGDSLAGKSRAAYEALRAALPNHTLVAPNSRDALPHALGAARTERRCVLWLNDLEMYLGPGGLTRAAVASVLAAGRGHRVILATLRAVEADRLTAEVTGADDLQRQVRRQAREALEQAHRIRLARLFTDSERARARAHVADPRIGDALNAAADFGIAEYLAAGPDLLSDWENAWSPNTDPDLPSHPRAAALVAAAIDIRCTGYASPMPRALLDRLHLPYLAERGGPRLVPESLESAWEWATRPRRVTTALLQPVGDNSVNPFDYLVDVVQRRRPPDHHVPETVIQEALLACSAVDADSMAVVAQRQGRHRLAEHAWRTAYVLRRDGLGGDQPDTITAHGRLAAALRDLGRRDEAESAFREVLADSTRVLGASHPHTLLARSELAFLLIDVGQFEEAESELRDVLTECVGALGPGHVHTLLARTNLALLLLATRRPDEAEAHLDEVVAVRARLDGRDHPGTLTARHYLAGAKRARGRLAEAEAEYREILVARTRLLGSNHPDTRATRDALGLLLAPVPAFNVVALGTVAAGKTVLLASMFHHLNSGVAAEGLRLRASLPELVRADRSRTSPS
jgi:tetratricopeptide (TPR) repeat protein